MIDIENLKQQHTEEIHDAEMYEHLADECPEWESVLRDIARDERTHARMLQHMIEYMTK